jgi:hypothetical protein
MNSNKLLACAAMSISMLLASTAIAAPKSQKTTYAQAWKICQKFVQEGVWSWDQHGQRFQRGGSCMLKYGYRFDSADTGGY